MSVKAVLTALADRTAVLFLGVGVGTAMGYAFAGDLAQMVKPASAPAPASVSAAAAKPVPKPAAAPIALECAMPFQPRLLETLTSGGRVRVGVFGDSFGDGLWAALYHQLHERDAWEVEKFSQQSTGFTRYYSLNLEEHLDEQIADEPIDIAVISFGANDTQGVMHKGKYAELLSPEWKEEIGMRIDRYIAKLRQKGAVVYWVGLPIMRKPSFDADISGMSTFFAERMERLGVPFIETRSRSVDASGGYAAYLPDAGSRAPRLMRANDGIHMSMHGYERLTEGLAVRIRRYVEAARNRARIEAGA